MPGAIRKDFLWGFATASAQIEGGGADEDSQNGKGPSIWDAFCDTPGKIADGTHVNKTCAHLKKYKEDVALMKSMGVNSYRFSISWPRVIPKGGKDDSINEEGLQFYSDLIDELLANGITPFVTLYHWDLPQALDEKYGGWLSGDIIPDFVNYAKLCFERYGDRVKHWLTFNEPWVICMLGYGEGAFAPGHKSLTEPYTAGHNLLLAHAHATKLYRDNYKASSGGQIGITLNGDFAIPYSDSDEDKQAAQDYFDAAIGWFADPLYLGQYPPRLVEFLGDRLPKFTEEERKLIHGSSDFYGMNTYTSYFFKAGGDDPHGMNVQKLTERDGKTVGHASELGWLWDVPTGVRGLLNYLYKRYNIPIFMTENGFAIKGESSKSKEEALSMCNRYTDGEKDPDGSRSDDTERVRFYNGYLSNVKAAIEEDGVDVRSYFAWSLMDNFEWASGLVPRFGCVYVDFDTFERTPKASAKEVSRFFKENVPSS